MTIDSDFIQWLRRRNYKERDVSVLEAKMTGLTNVDIGKTFGITGNRVAQIYRRYERISNHPHIFKIVTSIESGDLLALKLVPRTYRILHGSGITTIAQLETFIENGSARLLKIDGLGAKDTIHILDCLINHIKARITAG